MAENEIIENAPSVVEEKAPEVEVPEIDYAKELAKLRLENEKLKKAQSNACADASEWKKKFRATQTEQEQKAAEQAEELAKLIAQNDEYKARERKLNYVSKLMENGYDSETAKNMADALPEGIGDEFFAEQKRFCEGVKTKAREEALNQQPSITAGKTPSADMVQDKDLEAFTKAAFGRYI